MRIGCSLLVVLLVFGVTAILFSLLPASESALPGGHLAVWVETEEGKGPITGVTVAVLDRNRVIHRRRVDAWGRALFHDLPPGLTWSWALSRRGYAISGEELHVVRPGRWGRQFLVRDRAESWRGRVFLRGDLPEPVPLAGARVRAHLAVHDGMTGHEWRRRLHGVLDEGVTDRNGRVYLPGVLGELTSASLVIEVAAAGMRRICVLDDGNLDRYRILVDPGGSLSGVVTGMDGGPCEGVAVCALPLPDRESFFPAIHWWRGNRPWNGLNTEGEIPLCAVTGADGSYSIDGLAFGLTYTVRARKLGEGWAEAVEAIRVTSGSPGGRLDLSLQPGGTLTVTVEDEEGMPVEGAVVELEDAGAPQVVTGKSGTARIPAMPPGSYMVYAAKPGFGYGAIEQAWLEAGQDRRVTLELDREELPPAPKPGRYHLDVRVADERGLPVADGKITLEPGGYRGWIRNTGAARLRGIPPGRYVLRYESEHYEGVEQVVGIPDNTLRLQTRSRRGLIFVLEFPLGPYPPSRTLRLLVRVNGKSPGGYYHFGRPPRTDHLHRMAIAIDPEENATELEVGIRYFKSVKRAVRLEAGGCLYLGTIPMTWEDRTNASRTTGRNTEPGPQPVPVDVEIRDPEGHPMPGWIVEFEPRAEGVEAVEVLADSGGRARVLLPPGAYSLRAALELTYHHDSTRVLMESKREISIRAAESGRVLRLTTPASNRVPPYSDD